MGPEEDVRPVAGGGRLLEPDLDLIRMGDRYPDTGLCREFLSYL